MTIEVLTELHYAQPRNGPWALYVFDRHGFHGGKKWFRKGPMKYPDEEITAAAAKDDVNRALAQGLEVRICDGLDELVFHAKGIKQIHPANAEDFWKVVGI